MPDELAALTQHYQQLLEGRRHLTPDHDLWDDITHDLHQAHKAMEVAWLNTLSQR